MITFFLAEVAAIYHYLAAVFMRFYALPLLYIKYFKKTIVFSAFF